VRDRGKNELGDMTADKVRTALLSFAGEPKAPVVR
jgi:hypothetical protein